MKMLLSLFIILSLLSSACTDNSGESDENALENERITTTIVSPGDEISGLAWGAGLLWAVDASSNMVFSINTTTGNTVDSFPISHARNLRTTGLAFSDEHDVLIVGLWDYGTDGYVYQYTLDGLQLKR